MRFSITSWKPTLGKLDRRSADKKRRAQRRPRTAHIEPLEPRQLLASDFGEVGTLTLSQPNAGTWQEITLARDYVNPVVIAGPLSTGGPNPAMVRIRDVDAATDTFEVQIDTATGEILQVAIRRSDLIESIHDGTYFNDHFKLWVFLPAGIVLATMVITGLHLFLLPYLVRRKRAR